jgi:hypothetical protein
MPREVLENKNCVSQIKLQFKATAIDKIKKKKPGASGSRHPGQIVHQILS